MGNIRFFSTRHAIAPSYGPNANATVHPVAVEPLSSRGIERRKRLKRLIAIDKWGGVYRVATMRSTVFFLIVCN